VPEVDDNFNIYPMSIRLERTKSDDNSEGSWIDFRTGSNLISDKRVAFDLLHLLSHVDGASLYATKYP